MYYTYTLYNYHYHNILFILYLSASVLTKIRSYHKKVERRQYTSYKIYDVTTVLLNKILDRVLLHLTLVICVGSLYNTQ